MGDAAVSADRSRPIVAPANNEEGARHGQAQIYRLRKPGWRIIPDRRADAIYLRGPNSDGPTISYWLPEQPLILLCLDLYSGELVGVDITEIKELARTDPIWRKALAGWAITGLLGRIPLLRWIARRQAEAVGGRAKEQAQKLTPASA